MKKSVEHCTCHKCSACKQYFLTRDNRVTSSLTQRQDVKCWAMYAELPIISIVRVGGVIHYTIAIVIMLL